MPFQFSVAARNAALDAIETAVGTGPTLTIRTGAVPANCAAARTGTVLATLVLPSNWLADASGGTKGIAGTWSDLSADAGGTAGHFSIDQGATCHIQGTVTATSGGGDLQLDNVTIVAGGAVTITAFALTAGGA
jgi:hypothetical protein